MRLVRDCDCPRCGFPETVRLVLEKGRTIELIGEQCSKRCGWVNMKPGYAIAAVFEPMKLKKK